MDFKTSPQHPKRAARRDYRVHAIFLAILGTAALGYALTLLPERGVAAVGNGFAAPASRADLSSLPASPAERQQSSASSESELEAAPAGQQKALSPEATETKKILRIANEKIQAKQFDAAISFLHEARAVLKQNPQSYLMMARALEGKADYDTARDFYAAAIDRNRYLAEAYYGFATASEALGDLEAAIGGMRSFLHVQPNADPQKLKIVQARSAIWEWESKLGRGPWGPTKGIPPGFSEAELKRDGRGVGVKIQRPETLQADGTMKYDVKAQDKFKIFKP